MDVMDADSLRANVRQVVDEQERFCKDVQAAVAVSRETKGKICLLYTSPSPRDLSTSRMPSSA